MKWNYRCTECNAWGVVYWESRTSSFKCNSCGKIRVPPGPAEQYDAYVDTHDWPIEIEDVVVTVKGMKCTVPGCTKNYETLDHRVPYTKGGRTSVNNLFPMCKEHNDSKRDTGYAVWIKML